MISIPSLSTQKTNTPASLHLFFFFSCLLLFSLHLSIAKADGPVTFSWQSNPTENNITGYKVYYGIESRFDSNGQLKINFNYEYYIDFSEMIRCYANPIINASCETLSLEDLQCENLFQENPACMISKLRGYLYFALTAYNAQEESSYTYELVKDLRDEPVEPEITGALEAIRLLLLK